MEANRRNTVDLVRLPSPPSGASLLGGFRGYTEPPCAGLPSRGSWLCPCQPRCSPWSSPSQVSTHHLHSSSEDEDAEGAFPNELSLQQVGFLPGYPRAVAVTELSIGEPAAAWPRGLDQKTLCDHWAELSLRAAQENCLGFAASRCPPAGRQWRRLSPCLHPGGPGMVHIIALYLLHSHPRSTGGRMGLSAPR